MPPHVPFAGRDAEVAVLDAALGRAAEHGRGSAWTLSGPPGAGKTTIAERVAEAAELRGWTVAWARSWEHGGAPPYWPWTQLLRGVIGGCGDAVPTDLHAPVLAAVLPELGEAPELPSPFEVYDAVRRGVTAAAKGRPLLLFLDDLHSADVSSLRLTSFLLPALRGVPVVFLATRRNAEANPVDPGAVANVVRLCQEVLVGPLTPQAIGSLLESYVCDSTPAVAERLFERTGGNALFLTGLLRSAVAEGRTTELLQGTLPAPDSVRAALQQQLSGLEPSTLELLRAAAAIRRAVSRAMLVEVSGQSPAEVEKGLTEAVHGRVLRASTDGACMRFAHDLFTEVLTAEMPTAAREALHMRIADALGRSGERPAERARHLVLGGSPDAADATAEAARAAVLSCAYDTAAELYGVVQTLARDADARHEAQLHRGRALHRAGRVGEAIETFSAIQGSPSMLARAAIAHSRCIEFSVADPDAVAALERAAKALDAKELDLRVHVLSQLAQRIHAASAFRERAASVGRELEAVDASLLAPRERHARHVALFYVHWGPSQAFRRLEIVRAMEADLTALSPAEQLDVHRYALNLAWERCDGMAARRHLTHYSALAEDIGDTPLRAAVLLRRCALAQLRGEFDEAHDLLEAQREVHQRIGSSFEEFFYITGHALGWLETGSGPDPTEHLEMIERTVESHWGHYPGVALAGFGWRVLVGQRDEVAGTYRHKRSLGFASSDSWGLIHEYAFMAEAALLLEDADGGRQLLERAESMADRNAQTGMYLPMGPLARPLGRVAMMVGDLDRAIRLLRRAAELCESLGSTYWLAHTRADLSEALERRNGLTAEAHGMRRAAAREADARGWAKLAARIGKLETPPTAKAVPRPSSTPEEAARPARLLREGDAWRVEFGGRTVRLRHQKGLAHIERLVERPHEPLHALELMQAHAGASRGGDEVVDPQALAAYRSRAQDLSVELQEATAAHDLARAEKIREELEAVTDHLLEASGLGGRTRRTTSDAERARSAVTQAIRRATKKIAGEFPELAHHLRNALHTGMLCVYAPEPDAPVHWNVGPEP